MKNKFNKNMNHKILEKLCKMYRDFNKLKIQLRKYFIKKINLSIIKGLMKQQKNSKERTQMKDICNSMMK